MTNVQLNFDFSGTPYVEKQVGEENPALRNQNFVDQNSNYPSLQQRLTRDRARSNITKESTDKMASISNSIQPDPDLRDENIVENLDDEHLYAANIVSLKQTQVGEQSRTAFLFENLDCQDFGHENCVKTQWQAKENTARVESSDGHLGETNGLEKLNSLPLSKAPLQEWTDEQLDILDMDD